MKMSHTITSVHQRAAKVLGLSLLVTGSLLATSVGTIAQAQQSVGGVVFNPALTGPELPDFQLISVGNKLTSGPMAIYRYGSCKHSLRVVAKNTGGKYQYNMAYKANIWAQPVTAGQVLVKVEKLVNGRVRNSDTRFFSGWEANEVKTIDFNQADAGWFPTLGPYTLRARIIPCKRGSSQSSCATFPEARTNNNSGSINVYVNHTCPSS